MSGAAEPPEAFIPHRPPILCVDEIVEMEEERVVCAGLVQAGPHAPAGEMWEEGLIEGLAQAAAVLHGAQRRRRDLPPVLGMLVGIRGFAVRRRARAGERVRYAVELVRRLAPFTLLSGVASVGEEVLARGELKFYQREEEG